MPIQKLLLRSDRQTHARQGPRRAVLSNTNLAGAILDGADLRGVDLSDTSGLTREQIARALIDDSTQLPSALA